MDKGRHWGSRRLLVPPGWRCHRSVNGWVGFTTQHSSGLTPLPCPSETSRRSRRLSCSRFSAWEAANSERALCNPPPMWWRGFVGGAGTDYQIGMRLLLAHHLHPRLPSPSSPVTVLLCHPLPRSVSDSTILPSFPRRRGRSRQASNSRTSMYFQSVWRPRPLTARTNSPSVPSSHFFV